MNRLRPTREQERWGAAVALLSMDVVTPFYQYMGVPTANPIRFRDALRAAILDNRHEFETDPSRIPDLRNRVLHVLTSSFDTESAQAFADWVQGIFVESGQDFEEFRKWHTLFSLSKNSKQRWDALGLPPSVSRQALAQVTSMFDFKDLHMLADQNDERPLSDWDLEMYSLHGFGEDNDPYDWVLESVEKKRFLVFLHWLVETLSIDERTRLISNANELKSQIETTREYPPLNDPKLLV